MANILVNVEKGIEIAVADALKWLGKAPAALTAAQHRRRRRQPAEYRTRYSSSHRPQSRLTRVEDIPWNSGREVLTVWPGSLKKQGACNQKLPCASLPAQATIDDASELG
jgi:hypothetical protein